MARRLATIGPVEPEQDQETLTYRQVAVALLENALAEAWAGHCTAIAAEIWDDAVRVSDNGRGLPLHPHPRSGRPLLEVILTGPRRGPKNTLARVNHGSAWVEVEVGKDGELWSQRYELALPATPLQRRGAATRRGTTISCAPVLGAPPRFEELRQEVRRLVAGRAPGAEPKPPQQQLKLRLIDRREAREETIVV